MEPECIPQFSTFVRFKHECLLRELQSVGIGGNPYTGCATISQAEHSESASTEPHLSTTMSHQESHNEAFSDPWCSSSSSMSLVMKLPRTQPYASLLMTPYATVRLSHTRAMSNYKTTSTSWWTEPQHGTWGLTQQSAMSCSLWPSTRKDGMRCPLHHGCSHTWENISQHIPSCHTLSFLERNLWLLPQNLRERAYLITMWPALECASASTDHHLSCDIKCLDSIHWHAVCFVTNNPWIRYDPEKDQVSMTTLLKDLGWDDRATRREELRCTLMYKILNDHVAIKQDLRPPYYKDNLSSTSQNKLQHTRSKSTVHGQSFFPHTVTDWNHLPLAVRIASSP